MSPDTEHPEEEHNFLNPEPSAELNILSDIKQLLETDVAQTRKQNLSKDETIDRLQKVVYSYEKGFIPSIKEPLLKDLILFKDSFNKFRTMFSESSETLTREIDFLNDEIEDIFFSHGIEIIHVEGDSYDRNLQIARKKVPTDNPDLDRTRVDVLKDGYKTEDKIIRKQEIAIYVLNEQTSKE